ncbi:MAG: alpha/beta hydrolase-fold protein [Phycisphaerae bacterium]
MSRSPRAPALLATFLAASVHGAPEGAPPGPATRPCRISDVVRDRDGFLVHLVESPYQRGKTKVRVLLPDRLAKGRRYRVVYVLPVEAGDGRRYGDGLAEIGKLDLHNSHELICVYPTFSHTPWYADHPTDPAIRQEGHLLHVVLPLIERTYPALAKADGRLLLGFSKSGWGAWSLLLRNPRVFGKAAAWDAPLTQARPDRWGMKEIFGTQENFAKYHVPSLLGRAAGSLGKDNRLALLGYGNFRTHHQTTHEQMLSLKVPHRYADGPRRRHHWAGGWLAEAVDFLAAGPK